MLTAILIKVGLALGGIALGWIAKKWHLAPYISTIEEMARAQQSQTTEAVTPTERPKSPSPGDAEQF